MEKKFNQKEYINKWKKENKSQFKVDLNKAEKEELDRILEMLNISKADFLRNAIKNFKEELKMKKYYVASHTQSFEKHGDEWIGCGDTTFGKDNLKIFDTIEEANDFYNSIELKDEISGCNRYSDYKEMYEINDDIDLDDIDGQYLDKQRFIKDDYSFTGGKE